MGHVSSSLVVTHYFGFKSSHFFFSCVLAFAVCSLFAEYRYPGGPLSRTYTCSADFHVRFNDCHFVPNSRVNIKVSSTCGRPVCGTGSRHRRRRHLLEKNIDVHARSARSFTAAAAVVLPLISTVSPPPNAAVSSSRLHKFESRTRRQPVPFRLWRTKKKKKHDKSSPSPCGRLGDDDGRPRV